MIELEGTQMDENKQSRIKNCLTIGTAECAVLTSLIALVLAILFLTIGFWKSLLVLVMILIGAFIGGVKNKGEFFGKLFPSRSGNFPGLENAVRGRKRTYTFSAGQEEAPAEAEEETAAEEQAAVEEKEEPAAEEQETAEE